MRKWWKARFCDQTSLRLVSNVIHRQEHKLILVRQPKKKRSLKRKKPFNNVPGGPAVVGGRAEEEMK